MTRHFSLEKMDFERVFVGRSALLRGETGSDAAERIVRDILTGSGCCGLPKTLWGGMIVGGEEEVEGSETRCKASRGDSGGAKRSSGSISVGFSERPDERDLPIKGAKPSDPF